MLGTRRLVKAADLPWPRPRLRRDWQRACMCGGNHPMLVLSLSRQGTWIERLLRGPTLARADRYHALRSPWYWRPDPDFLGEGLYRLTPLGALHRLVGLTIEVPGPPAGRVSCDRVDRQ